MVTPKKRKSTLFQRKITKALLGTFLLSVAIHLGFLGFLSFSPKINFDIKLRPPSEAEFGFIETELPEVQEEREEPSRQQPTEVKKEAEPKNKVKKATKTKPKKKKMSNASKGSNLPKGSLIGLRINMKQIRQTPLSSGVQQMLKNIPDWQAVLQGSGINPLQDLERILIASPNLYRSRIIIAGKYNPDSDLPKTAVQNLAKQQQKAAVWKLQNGVNTAPWHNVDRTKRFIALPEPGMFVIASKKDLPKALTLMQKDSKANMIFMQKNQLLTLEAFQIEKIFELPTETNFHPKSLQLHLEEKDGQVFAQAAVTFENAKESQDVLEQLSFLKNRYMSNPFVALTGMTPLLKSIELSRKNQQIQLETSLPYGQAQQLLGFLQIRLNQSSSSASNGKTRSGQSSQNSPPNKPTSP